MNRIAIGLLGIVLTVLTGCHHDLKALGGPATPTPNRVVTIRADPDNDNLCEVDYPIAVLRIRNKETIAWAAIGHEYWVTFSSNNPISASAIHIDKEQQINGIQVARGNNYYKYEIWKNTPRPYQPPCSAGGDGMPCKCADDDHDTGVNVKP